MLPHLPAVFPRGSVKLVTEVYHYAISHVKKIRWDRRKQSLKLIYLFLSFLLQPSFGFQFYEGKLSDNLKIPHKKENCENVAKQCNFLMLIAFFAHRNKLVV
jgi:hypothetical protein